MLQPRSKETIEAALRTARAEGGETSVRAPGFDVTKHGTPGIDVTKEELPGFDVHTGKGIKVHSGPIHSGVAGRTDHLPMHVESGSYVIPADIVSAMGEGNTIAGFKHMKRIFGGTPYGDKKTPYAQGLGPRGHDPEEKPYDDSEGPYSSELPSERSAGGRNGTVPIVAAGGEYVLSPDDVRKVGEGDLDIGHRVLDEFVKRYRARTVETLKKLPGPSKS